MELFNLPDDPATKMAWGKFPLPKNGYIDPDGVPRDRFSRPLIVVDDQLEPMMRASSFSDLIEDKSGLFSWRLARIFEGIMADTDLGNSTVVAIAEGKLNAKFGRGAAAVNQLAKLGGASRAADRGTIVHKALEEYILDGCEDVNRHTPFLHADEQRLVENGAAALEALGLEVLGTEVFIANEAFGVAGTADLVVRFKEGLAPDAAPDTLKDGTPFIADWKSYKDHKYNRLKASVQMSMYADGAPVDLETGGVVDWDEQVHRNVGLIIHLHPDGSKVEAHFMNLAEGRTAAKLCRQVREARKNPARFAVASFVVGGE